MAMLRDIFFDLMISSPHSHSTRSEFIVRYLLLLGSIPRMAQRMRNLNQSGRAHYDYENKKTLDKIVSLRSGTTKDYELLQTGSENECLA